MQKRGNKIIFTFLIAMLFCCFYAMPVLAEDSVYNLANIPLIELDKKHISDTFSKQVQAMSDQELNRFLVDLMNKEPDKRILQEKLAKIGIEAVIKDVQPAAKTASMEDTDLNLEIGAYLRHGDTYWRLIATYDVNNLESIPASYDTLGIYWDSSKASYWSYDTDGYSTLRDSTQYNNGLLLFNVHDKDFNTWTYYYDAVYIVPNTTGWIDFGVKYTHTYGLVQKTYNVTSGITFSFPGIVTGSINYSVTTQYQEAKWERSDTNAFYRS